MVQYIEDRCPWWGQGEVALLSPVTREWLGDIRRTDDGFVAAGADNALRPFPSKEAALAAIFPSV